MEQDFNTFMNDSSEGKKKVAVGVSVYPDVKSQLDEMAAEKSVPVSTVVARMIDYCLAQS